MAVNRDRRARRSARPVPLLVAVLIVLGGLLSAGPAGAAPEPGPPAERPAPAAATGTMRNPVNSGPDPFVTHFQGRYYLATTQGDAVRMWSAESAADLLRAEPRTVWKPTDPSGDRMVWAPEFYRFDGRWYLYYTASDGVDEHHRLFVAESEGDDPMGPYHHKAKLEPPNHVGEFAIDAAVVRHGGKLYLAYSGLNAYQHNGLNIAPMSDPWTVSGDATALNAAGGCPEVREGPAFLERNGRTWMTYSACDTGKPDYQVWMMSLDAAADPLDAGAWRQHQGALFARNDEAGVFGPGHHSFFRSPDGAEDWIVYHAKTTSQNTYTDRTTRIQRIGWNGDGSPALGRPLAVGATLDLPSGDPGPGTYWINDDGRSNGPGGVAYTGTWNSGTGCAAQCFFGDDHWSEAKGNTATWTFEGTRIALLSVRDTGNGYADISVDGGAPTRVDLHDSIRKGEVVQYVSPQLPSGRHTLRVTVTGERNASAGAAFVSVDRAEVWTD
ncbi:family 43 glycosylhydrolase [Streptomyces sp. Z26]|uniref:family 43 glycosylhydrolase n=1 Tax=Streptomyces sp. Z26 TaxID=2500177 RepID=UPI000EF131D7|nr:family 43 glycosylhydrolase [Streptomyces sp. Z26]RLL65951.1 hydrolase [Streptomyces sp. Z26]